MRRNAALLLTCALFMLTLAGCGVKYTEKDFIGKSSAEIIAEFGAFDCVLNLAAEDGLYRNTRCGYTIKEPRKGPLGTSAELLFFICFDEDAIAVSCEKGHRPGG